MHHDCSSPIVHRDISSNNILLDSEYKACVSDFGTAKILKLDISNWSAVAGTYGYIAPALSLEVIKGKHPSDNIDSLLSLSIERKQLNNMLDE
ncbi:hypothetical protein LguiB_013583 [Lonicera macranthoides]